MLQYEDLKGIWPSSLPVNMGPLTALRRLGVRRPNSAAGSGAGAVHGVAMGGLGLVGGTVGRGALGSSWRTQLGLGNPITGLTVGPGQEN